MWRRACNTGGRFRDEVEEYNKKTYHKTHREPELREGDQLVVSTLNFNNLKGPKKMSACFVGKFTIISLIGKNAVEFKLTEEFSRKHWVFPVSWVRPYHQTGEDIFPCRNKGQTPQGIVAVEDSPGPVKKSSKPGRLDLMGKTIDNTWSGSRTRQLTKTNGWQNMPYQMVTFT
ncbi:hypothetical protein O181_001587 [Austropuccinia psidii MF-1]|uniref:Tf2-1-like SH3-like domain-containing protein n=1 Tax=Austropuccinia psidii MF-1 TaxID=1389203 RepID=A0A9Q3BAW3_9BASI|nr:hypothetical protein [Austropuccinia psidii MF-1]